MVSDWTKKQYSSFHYATEHQLINNRGQSDRSVHLELRDNRLHQQWTRLLNTRKRKNHVRNVFIHTLELDINLCQRRTDHRSDVTPVIVLPIEVNVICFVDNPSNNATQMQVENETEERYSYQCQLWILFFQLLIKRTRNLQSFSYLVSTAVHFTINSCINDIHGKDLAH